MVSILITKSVVLNRNLEPCQQLRIRPPSCSSPCEYLEDVQADFLWSHLFVRNVNAFILLHETSKSCSFSFLLGGQPSCSTKLFPCVEYSQPRPLQTLYMTAVVICTKKGLGWMVDLVCYNVLFLLFTEVRWPSLRLVNNDLWDPDVSKSYEMT